MKIDGISNDSKVICILPGSRSYIAKKMLRNVMKQTIENVIHSNPSQKFHVIVPCVPHLKDTVELEVISIGSYYKVN